MERPRISGSRSECFASLESGGERFRLDPRHRLALFRATHSGLPPDWRLQIVARQSFSSRTRWCWCWRRCSRSCRRQNATGRPASTKAIHAFLTDGLAAASPHLKAPAALRAGQRRRGRGRAPAWLPSTAHTHVCELRAGIVHSADDDPSTGLPTSIKIAPGLASHFTPDLRAPATLREHRPREPLS